MRGINHEHMDGLCLTILPEDLYVSWGFSDFTMQAAAAFVASFQALDPTLARPALFGGPHWCHPHSTSTSDLTNP